MSQLYFAFALVHDLDARDGLARRSSPDREKGIRYTLPGSSQR